jgi:AcrR family transcriptional regulator
MGTARTAVKESPTLRQRLIDAASTILVEEGYGNLSMRRVAQEVKCSQMAMYRHFANKEALIQHLCAEVYTRFTARMFREMEAADGPWDRIRLFIAALLKFAVSYPDHYSLIFLQRHSDPEVNAERERLGEEFLKVLHQLVRELLPINTPLYISDMRLRQMLTCTHGTAALLIAHPKAYGLTQKKAIVETDEAVARLLGYSEPE